jgi:hypothetical protein
MTMTVTATKIDSSNESGKNFITWAWPASTTIIYDSPVFLFKRNEICDAANITFASIIWIQKI